MKRDTLRTDRAFAISFLGNVGLATVKLFVGFLAGSPALIADGWHSASDVATHGGAWLAFRLGQRAPDADHHYGHGKLEAFAGLLVGLFLLFGGAGVVIIGGGTEKHLATDWTGWLALGVAAASIVANLGLAWVAHSAGNAAGSTGLRALARDNSSDALTGVLVVAGILGSRGGFAWAERSVAVVIGILIVLMGWRSVREGFDVLMDRVAESGLQERLTATANAVTEVRGVQRVRVHPVGDGWIVDMEISVDGELSVVDGHAIAHRVENAIVEAYPHVKEVHVHVNPAREASLPTAVRDR